MRRGVLDFHQASPRCVTCLIRLAVGRLGLPQFGPKPMDLSIELRLRHTCLLAILAGMSELGLKLPNQGSPSLFVPTIRLANKLLAELTRLSISLLAAHPSRSRSKPSLMLSSHRHFACFKLRHGSLMTGPLHGLSLRLSAC